MILLSTEHDHNAFVIRSCCPNKLVDFSDLLNRMPTAEHKTGSAAIRGRLHNWVRLGIVSCTLLLFLYQQAFTQAPEIRRYRRLDGIMSEVYNFHMLSDSRGFLWGSSSAGLYRFNGKDFKYFTPQHGLPDRLVLRTMEGPDHRIWLCNYSGKLSYVDGDSIRLYAHNDSINRYTQLNRSWSCHTPDNETFFIGGRHYGLIRVDRNGSVTTAIPSLHGQKVMGLWQADSAHIVPFLYAPVVRGGVYIDHLRVYDSNLENYRVYELADSLLFKDARPYAYPLSRGDMVFAMGRDLLLLGPDSVAHADLDFGMITSVFQDQQGHLWVTSLDQGAYRFLNSDIRTTPQRILPQEQLHWACEDFNGGIWLSSSRSGVHHIPDMDIELLDSTNSRLIADELTFFAASDHHLYSYQGDGRLLRWRGNAVEHIDLSAYFSPKSNPPKLRTHWHEATRSLYVSEDDDLIRMDPSGKITPVQVAKPEFPQRIIDYHDHPDGSLCIMLDHSLLRVVEDSVTVLLKDLPDRMSNILVDPNGEIFMGGFRGVWQLEGNSVRLITSDWDNRSFNLADCLHHKGALWASSLEMGLNRVSGQTLVPATNHEVKGMGISNMWLEEDTIWTIGGSYLFKYVIYSTDSVTREQVRIRHFADFPIYDLAIVNDTFYISCVIGFLRFHRSALSGHKAPPRVHLTGLRINDRDTTIQTHYDLDYDQNYLRMTFTGVSYDQRELSYRYRLSGLDEDWKYSEQPTVQYTQLPPGTYTFSLGIKGENSDWNDVVEAVSFTIATPYWATWWFRSLIVLSLLGLISWQVYRQFQRLETKRRNEQRLMQLESKALRAQMNPHFIFNVLGAIQGYVSEGDSEASQIYLSKFAHLIRLILENSRRSFIPLGNEVDTLQSYIELERMRFRNQFRYTITWPEAQADALIPPMMIQPYVENAILHGLSNASGEGLLSIRMEIQDGFLHCEITDNGPGMTRTREEQKPDRGHQPLGMTISRERLELLKMPQTAQPKIQILNIADHQPEQGGTRVIIDLPLIGINEDTHR